MAVLPACASLGPPSVASPPRRAARPRNDSGSGRPRLHQWPRIALQRVMDSSFWVAARERGSAAVAVALSASSRHTWGAVLLLFDAIRAPLPAPMDDRGGQQRLFHRPRQHHRRSAISISRKTGALAAPAGICAGALSNERPYRDHRADVNSRTVAFGYWKSPRVNVARSRFKRPSTA